MSYRGKTDEELQNRAERVASSLETAQWEQESAEARLVDCRMRVHGLNGELMHINNILSDREQRRKDS